MHFAQLLHLKPSQADHFKFEHVRENRSIQDAGRQDNCDPCRADQAPINGLGAPLDILPKA